MKRCDCGCWQGKEGKKDPPDREVRPEGRPKAAAAAEAEARRAEKER